MSTLTEVHKQTRVNEARRRWEQVWDEAQALEFRAANLHEEAFQLEYESDALYRQADELFEELESIADE